ncbi:MAG TPA: thioredoxin domain-containing protein [Prosthecobacter sp.]|nr:thioredoxin domain-containing protein [Prosthecobacter sp.]
MSETPRHTNALAREKSPYLLQHAHNPVNWMPWGDEAIAKARAEDKPIFLSSGYSTCHWCHVMERESFENEEVAKLINDNFIPIKVDREERPDVDLTYMTYVQAASGGGGWPMTVFLTPDLKPFFGGTYFPPENTQGRIGFKNLLKELSKAWNEDREKVLNSSNRSVEKLQEYLDGENTGQQVKHDLVIQKAYDDLAGSYDYHEGGFSGAPKFPRSSSINLLFRIHRAWEKDEAKKGEADWAAEMSVKTLRAMANGGIWDHVGGGFHRYSVDSYWHIPHYEKMLYDQGQLLWAYAEGYLISGSPFRGDIARQIAEYVRRDLRHPKGGFFSAEDADSYAREGDDHKKEGSFYIWTAAEIDEILGKEEGSIFRYSYGARRDGNARPESDPHGELKGTNTLFRAFSARKTAEYFKKTPEEVQAILSKGIKALFEVRAKRPRPHLDDKVITAWNGLMISGLARAGAALGESSFIKLASEAAQFIHDEICATPGKGLHRSWREGERGPKAFASDYASLIHSLLDLYQAGFEVKWLQWAVALQDEMDSLFLDRDKGGYYTVHTDMAHSVLRIKEDYDGAEPSPNSLAALNLARLAAMLDNKEYAARAEKTVTLFGSALESSPAAVPMLVTAFDFLQRGKQQIVLAGDSSSSEFKALAATVHKRFLPNAVLLHADGADAQSWLGQRNQALAAMQPVNGKPAAYVCQNYACQAPVTDPAALDKLLA